MQPQLENGTAERYEGSGAGSADPLCRATWPQA